MLGNFMYSLFPNISKANNPTLGSVAAAFSRESFTAKSVATGGKYPQCHWGPWILLTHSNLRPCSGKENSHLNESEHE